MVFLYRPGGLAEVLNYQQDDVNLEIFGFLVTSVRQKKLEGQHSASVHWRCKMIYLFISDDAYSCMNQLKHFLPFHHSN